jgi:DNA polymerase elongation subunit (family B)
MSPNLYDWIIDSDYSSLYPSIIRSLNLSIDTFVGRIKTNNQNYNTECSLIELEKKDPKEILTIEKLNKKTYTLIEGKASVETLLSIIKENNLIISANGTIFDSSKKSIIAEVLTDWFIKRKEFKDKMKDAYKNGDEINGELYNKYQHSFKILLNGVYGCFSVNSWRFTDGHKICSSAITTTGQRFVMETIKYADKMIKEEYIK